METASERTRKAYTPRYVNEDENFWRNHIDNFSLSGLTKTDYCKQNRINYGRFFYWTRILSHPKPHQKSKTAQDKENRAKKIEKFLPVQVKRMVFGFSTSEWKKGNFNFQKKVIVHLS